MEKFALLNITLCIIRTSNFYLIKVKILIKTNPDIFTIAKKII
jgi:hypothetical protein